METSSTTPRLIYQLNTDSTFFPVFQEAKRKRKSISEQQYNKKIKKYVRGSCSKQASLNHERNLQIQASIWSSHLFAKGNSTAPNGSSSSSPNHECANLALTVPRSNAQAKKLFHPLEKFPEEVSLWVHDEMFGSFTSAARVVMNIPEDTIERAAWRNVISMEQSVLSMSVKDKRRLYLLMRHLTGGGLQGTTRCDSLEFVPCQKVMFDGRTEAAADTSEFFVPKMGMTLGQLSAFHILLTRTKFIKTKDLVELVGDASKVPVPMPIPIEE